MEKKKEKRVIALVDCDNFFVSCERLRRPELVGVPVCVLSNNDGCVVSRSNEAKKMGIAMGAPYFMIKHQFKKVKFLSGDLSYYCEISSKVMQKLYDFTPDVEIYSIDEAFLDLTGLRKTFNCSYQEIVKKIAREIKEEIGVDVSIGLSYSKVLSKLASDKSKELQKLGNKEKTYVIGFREIKKELKETLISDIWGVGKNTSAFLKKYLIQTAFEFVSQEDVWIKKNLGKIGLDLKQELLGYSINKVNSLKTKPKSVSRSESFKEFQKDFSFIAKELNGHIHKVCKKLRKDEQMTSCICVFLRTKDFMVYSAKVNLIAPTNAEFELVEHAKRILESLFQKGVLYRSVGFYALKLTDSKNKQISLFNQEKAQKMENLALAWDKLEDKFGKGIVKIG